MRKKRDGDPTGTSIFGHKVQALVAVMNDPMAWRLVQEQLWYRIPVEKAPKRWPPQWLAFYQTKIFRDEAYSVRYYGQIKEIRRVKRTTLFPDEFPNTKSEHEYYQVILHSLEILPRPIVSYRLRRVVFIPTTYHKLMAATEINDLFDDSPLEDALWEELKKLSLQAERQYHLQATGQHYFLDFALFCAHGKVNVEADGDRWHNDPARVPDDNRRNNALASEGWQVLRFNTHQIKEEMTEYCVPRITETVNQLGGLSDTEEAPRVYYATQDGIVQQLTLFDRAATYTVDEDESD